MTQWVVVDAYRAYKLSYLWYKHIQKEFFEANPKMDRLFWDIRLIYFLYFVFNVSQDTKFAILLDDSQTGYNKIAAVGVFAKRYNCLCVNEFRPHRFIWYIMKNPRTDVKNIFQSFIDTQFEQNDFVWLHADPSGGESLVKYYIKNGFKKCPCKLESKATPFRRYDGRYLYRLIY